MNELGEVSLRCALANKALGAVSSRDAAQRALMTLTGHERAVIVLRDREDLSESDTAEHLSIPGGRSRAPAAGRLADCEPFLNWRQDDAEVGRDGRARAA